MGYTERDIDGSYKLFARYHQPPDAKSPFNVFNEEDWSKISDWSSSEGNPSMQWLIDNDVFFKDSKKLVHVPLEGLLVLPDGEGPFPLHVIAHGNSTAYYPSAKEYPPSPDTGARHKQVPSYQGYKYLQQHLGDHGIASLSVNLNVVNGVNVNGATQYDRGDDVLQRVQCLLLHLILLKALSGKPTTGTLPVSVLQKGQKELTPLAAVLELQPPLTEDSPQKKVRDLKTLLTGKLNFDNLSFMGHSRGANAAADIFAFFGLSAQAPPGMTPSGSAPPPPSPALTAPTLGRFGSTPPHVNTLTTLTGLVATLGNPKKEAIKCIIALQPEDKSATIQHPGLFFLAFASSHDSDVKAAAINIYESPICAKASVFSHGATHGRFNTIWRELDSIKTAIERDMRCQAAIDPIRILSNQGHEDLAKNFLGEALLATQTAQPSKLKLYTGETRATIKQDVERMWKFAFPFDHAPSILELDARVTGLAKKSTKEAKRPNPEGGQDQQYYTQELEVFRAEKPARETRAFNIAIQSSDSLGDFTHFSFRYAKEYNPFSKSERAAEPLRNFELRLFAGTNPIGSPITGNAISSVLQRAYPVQKSDSEMGVCSDETHILLQTQEVPLTQFFGRTSMHTISDLTRVDKIEFRLLPSSGRANDVYVFVDFVLTYRVFP